MNFSSPRAVENTIYDMLLASWPRARNRAEINALFNGAPPFSEHECRQNNIETNYNDLSSTHIDQQARAQFSNALITPDPLVNIEIDYGPTYKRREWQELIQREINKRMKNSLAWLEEEKSTFAQVVLHGIAPALWHDREKWCPRSKSVGDVLVPGGVYRDLDNLPFFAVYEQYTAKRLWEMVSGPYVDPGWNVPMAKSLIQWVMKAYENLGGTVWPDPWKAEQWEERIKEDAGFFATDRMPTIDTYHLYYWSDEGKNSGWRKKIILDSWGQPGSGSIPAKPADFSSNKYGKERGGEDMPRDNFLYDGGKKKYGNKLGSICHWQFGDASSVAPFMYHSVRSLGFLLFAICEIQNRIKCRLTSSVFEATLQYLIVNDPQDAERAIKLDLVDKGVIPPGVSFMKAQDRWQVPQALVEFSLQLNEKSMRENSSSFTETYDFNKENQEETATHTMARVNATSAMVGQMLNDAYDYQKYKLIEVCRRFCIKDSSDIDVRQFRTECLKAGIPIEALNVERWNVSPYRIIGNGSKTLQIAMMDKIMFGAYDKLNGDAQQEALRLYIAVNSGDYNLANQLVPLKKQVSPAVINAQRDAGAIMSGIMVTPSDGENQVDYIESQLHAMASVVQGIEQTGSMATQEQVKGLDMLGANIGQHIQILGQDKGAKQRVKIYGDELGELMNLVKAYAQRLQEQKGKNGQQLDPETMGKIQSMIILAQSKAKINADAHAQRTAQRQLQFEQKVRQDTIEHKVHVAKQDLEAAANVRRGGMKSLQE